jgi:hypothetical protein
MQLLGIAIAGRLARRLSRWLAGSLCGVDSSPPPARPIEPLDVAPSDQIPLGRANGRQPACPDRLPQPAGIAPDDPGRLGHAQRVAGLVEVAVMAEIAVVDRAAVDRVAGRPAGSRVAELAACPARVVGPPARRSAERLVGPGDCLELPLGVGLRASAVRVVGPGQPPEGDLDLGVGRRPRDAERGVVIGPGRRRPSAGQAGPRDDASAARDARDVSPIARLMCAPSGVNGSRSWLQRSIAIRA